MLKLAAMGCGLLLVVTAQQRLQKPETHRVLGRLMGQPTAVSTQAAIAGPERADAVLPAELLATIDDNAPFTASESEAWFALLDLAMSTDVSAGLPATYSQLRSQPDVYRARAVQVRGTIRRVEEVEPAANDRGIEKLYRLVLQDEGGNVWPTTIYTLQEPTDTLPYETVVVGYFFKNLSYQYEGGVGTTPVIVARSAPLATADSAPITAQTPSPLPAGEPFDFRPPKAEGSLGRAMLAELGVDIGSFDIVDDRRRMKSSESHLFYSLLSAVERTPASQLVRIAQMGRPGYADRLGRPRDESLRARQMAAEVRRQAADGAYSVAPLFDPDHSLHGELMVFDTVVRRVLWVEAGESAPIEGYYELHAFAQDSQNLPMVFCMRSLPAGFPIGDDVRQPARLAGFFFKQWAYSTRRVDADNPSRDRRQFAPLFVGRAPIPLVSPSSEGLRPGWAVGIGGVSLLVLTAAALLIAWRGDRRYEASTLARYRRPASHAEAPPRADEPDSGN